MSAAVQAPPAVVAPEATLDPETIKYNEEVEKLAETVLNLASTIEDDMKMRQLPNGLVGKKVYGANAALRSTFNSLASILKKAADVVLKLKKGTTKKSNGAFVGFSAPSYIHPDMATAIGLREGTPLWPQGSKPVFSSAMITKFFTHRVLANGLVDQNDLSYFRCDDQMKRLFLPYASTSGKDGEPINLDRLSYTGIQKLIKNFVNKRTKETPAPVFGDDLKAIFVRLDVQFKALKETKDNLKKSILSTVARNNDVVKAKHSLDNGVIPKESYDEYVLAYKRAIDNQNGIYEVYRTQAKQMGISS